MIEKLEPDEELLYTWHLPSAPDVAKKLGISAPHLKAICRELGLPMANTARLHSSKPRWRIPRSTFIAVKEHLSDDRNRENQ